MGLAADVSSEGATGVIERCEAGVGGSLDSNESFDKMDFDIREADFGRTDAEFRTIQFSCLEINDRFLLNSVKDDKVASHSRQDSIEKEEAYVLVDADFKADEKNDLKEVNADNGGLEKLEKESRNRNCLDEISSCPENSVMQGDHASQSRIESGRLESNAGHHSGAEGICSDKMWNDVQFSGSADRMNSGPSSEMIDVDKIESRQVIVLPSTHVAELTDIRTRAEEEHKSDPPVARSISVNAPQVLREKVAMNEALTNEPKSLCIDEKPETAVPKSVNGNAKIKDSYLKPLYYPVESKSIQTASVKDKECECFAHTRRKHVKDRARKYSLRVNATNHAAKSNLEVAIERALADLDKETELIRNVSGDFERRFENFTREGHRADRNMCDLVSPEDTYEYSEVYELSKRTADRFVRTLYEKVSDMPCAEGFLELKENEENSSLEPINASKFRNEDVMRRFMLEMEKGRVEARNSSSMRFSGSQKALDTVFRSSRQVFDSSGGDQEQVLLWMERCLNQSGVITKGDIRRIKLRVRSKLDAKQDSITVGERIRAKLNNTQRRDEHQK